jgi:hypothetical protein
VISTVASSTRLSAEEVVFAVLMGVLAANLDGRRQVYFRKMEIGLTQEDLLRVAHSRGYSLIDHRVGKYYEFVFTPHQPGRLG